MLKKSSVILSLSIYTEMRLTIPMLPIQILIFIINVASLKAFFKMPLSNYIFISWQIKQS